MTLLKKLIIIIDAMIFKRFSLQRQKSELCYICQQEMLKSNFFSKNKSFRNSLLEYIHWPWLFHSYYNNLIHKVWVHLINEKQHKTQVLLGKISESHERNLSWGAMSTSRKLQLLESD